MTKIFFYAGFLIFTFGCSHNSIKSSNRNPAESGGGDVGSVGTLTMDCDNNYSHYDKIFVANLKKSSTAAADKILDPGNGVLLANQEDLKNINNMDIYKDFFIFEFNSNSATRGQVQDEILRLAENPRNYFQTQSYLDSQGNQCSRFIARRDSTRITPYKGSAEGRRVLKAEVFFNDGYHGGSNSVTMVFLFEVRNTIDRGPGSPTYIPRFTSYLSKYPLLKEIKYSNNDK